ncbi:hypothetical protein D3C73_1553260 [compost metagenome]
MFGQGERIARPASVVKRYGVGMTGEQQAACTGACTCQHIEFITGAGNRLYLNAEA